MRLWPDTLPGLIAPGYALSPVDQSVRSDMETGSRRLRRITRARADSVTASCRMTDAEFAAFSAWYYSEVWSAAGGSDTQTGWTGSEATPGASPVTGPDGIIPWRLTETVATAQHLANRSLALAPTDGAVRLAATLRNAGRRWARLGLVDRAGLLRWANIDLQTGAAGNQSGASDLRIEARATGWWRIALTVDSGTGILDPELRVAMLDDSQTAVFTGTGTAAIDICEVMVRPVTGYDLVLRTDEDGTVLGAAGGSAWVQMPLAFGGGVRTVEARFEAPFTAEALPGLGWQIELRLEVRNA